MIPINFVFQGNTQDLKNFATLLFYEPPILENLSRIENYGSMFTQITITFYGWSQSQKGFFTLDDFYWYSKGQFMACIASDKKITLSGTVVVLLPEAT